MASDSPRIARLREIEVWISRVRLQSVLERGSVFRLELPAG
jgi:hypothetical protein